MKYDQAYVDRFKPLAIASSKDLIIGQVYYGDHANVEGAVLLALKTNDAHYHEIGLEWDGPNGNVINWMTRQDSKGRQFTESLHDRNIDGGGYNPWLVFADQAIAKEYYDGLVVEFGPIPEWDDTYYPYD